MNRGTRRRAAVALAATTVALAAAGISSGGARPPATAVAPAVAARAAEAFLARYEAPDGRVVRTDQGGDTVSEGQAYAMLVAVQSGRRAAFARAWGWAASHLVGPGGLMAWHWAGGAVTGTEPAADADLGAAAALVRAARQWSDPGYLRAARRIAAAIATREVAASAAGPVLAAGPWATAPPARVDPSYLSPEELGVVAAAFGGPWPALAAAASRQLRSLTAGGTLASDWAIVGADGQVHPSGPPAAPGSPVRYGFDAARVPIWLAASCSRPDRAGAAGLLPALRRGGGQVGLDLGGRAAPGTAHPIGMLALAAATAAAGDGAGAQGLIAQAAAADRARPSYYGSAWLALTTLDLDHRLEACP